VALRARAIEPESSRELINAKVGRARTRPPRRNFVVLRASNRLLGLGSGRKLASLKANPGRPKPLNSGLPNTRGSISNLHCQGPRKVHVFLGF
jgi:hypothetical protein